MFGSATNTDDLAQLGSQASSGHARRARGVRPLAALLACAVLLAACHKEGPAEQAGKSLDNAGQKIQDAVDPPGPAQKAGRVIDDATGK